MKVSIIILLATLSVVYAQIKIDFVKYKKFNEHYCLKDAATKAEKLEYMKCEDMWPRAVRISTFTFKALFIELIVNKMI